MTTHTSSPHATMAGKGSLHGMLHVIATNSPYGTICQSQVRRLALPTRDHVRVFAFRGWQEVDWSAVTQELPEKLLLVCRLADIPENTGIFPVRGADRTHLVFVEDMPVEAISARVPRLNIRCPERLHITREQDHVAVAAIIGRAIAGMAEERNRQRIIDAWIEGEHLVVLLSDFERLHVPVGEMARWLGCNLQEIKAFEIDDDGSFLYWPHADTHMGAQQLQGIVDPAAILAAQQRSEAFNRQYGAAIRSMREHSGLKQADIAGIADRHLRRVEHGEVAASSSVLEALAGAHRMKLADYLTALAEHLN